MGFWSDSEEEIKKKEIESFIKSKGGVVNAVNPKNHELLKLEQNDVIIQLLAGILNGQGVGGLAVSSIVLGTYYENVKKMIE